jgi:hypothetical protein
VGAPRPNLGDVGLTDLDTTKSALAGRAWRGLCTIVTRVVSFYAQLLQEGFILSGDRILKAARKQFLEVALK